MVHISSYGDIVDISLLEGRAATMKLELKSSKLAPFVKQRLQELKKSLNLGSESEATAYLLEFYGEFYPSMRVVQHRKFFEQAKDMQKVQILDLKAGSKSKETGENGSL
jgi:hypothetical protein